MFFCPVRIHSKTSFLTINKRTDRILEEMWHSDPQTRYIVEDRIQTNLGVKPDRVDFKVQVTGNEKIINIKGYWKNGKYYPIPNGPIKIKSPIPI
jgi:hypothetical protein